MTHLLSSHMTERERLLQIAKLNERQAQEAKRIAKEERQQARDMGGDNGQE